MRQVLSKHFHISKQNEYAFLDLLGGECAGAITLLGTESTLGINLHNDTQWLSDGETISILNELPQHPMLAGNQELRLCLAGDQDKLHVVYDGRKIGLPKNNTPSSHILKPLIHGLEDTVINEAFCLRLAQTMGIPAAKSLITSFGDHRFLLVERYDRVKQEDGALTRLHQEDFCQALGVISKKISERRRT